MRILKWATIVAVVIAVIATAVYLRRDFIARDVANSLLTERGFVAKELKVKALTPNRLELKLLVIESESGARYEIRGLTLPLSMSGQKTVHFSADDLAITYDDERDSHQTLSATLRSVLELPRVQPGLEAAIGRVALPGWPVLTDVRWTRTGDGQALVFTIDALNIEAIAERTESDDYRIVIGATDANAAAAGSLDALLEFDGARYSATGDLAFAARAWLPLLGSLGLLPAGLDDLDAALHGPVRLELDAPEAGQAAIETRLSLGDELTASYSAADGPTTNVTVTAMQSLAIDLDYPANRWLARSARAASVISMDGLSDVPVTLSNIECRRGVICTVLAAVDAEPLTWEDYAFDAVSLSLPLTIATGETTRVRVSPESKGEFAGLKTGSTSASRVTITGFSGTEILVEDDGWRCRIEELRLAFAGVTATDQLRLAPKVTLREFEIGNSGKELAANIAIAAPLGGKWNDTALSLPGAEGTFSLRGEELLADVEITDLADAIAGSVQVRRNTETDTGSLVVREGWASFDRARLSDFFPATNMPFDILQGSWNIELDLDWKAPDGIPAYRGKTRMTLDGIGGTYTDIAFVGLGTELAATLEAPGGFTLSPSPVSIRLLDVGIPIENIVFDYAVDVGVPALRVDNLSLNVFGGEVLADPFEYRLSAGTNAVILHARAIQLQLMVDTLEFESLELTGTISGRLPVTMRDKSITISGGTLQSDTGGGTIRYRSADASLGSIAKGAGIGAVTRALTNFEFESLSSTVDYVEDGDMRMRMRLVGINPDLDPNQPYAFNLNLENNIPQMLRSLRAVRSIEDILQQQTDK